MIHNTVNVRELLYNYLPQFLHHIHWKVFQLITCDSPFPDIPTISVDANGVLKLQNELDTLKRLDQIKYLHIF